MKVEAPVAPGGMTGGVEFEAMGYLVCAFSSRYFFFWKRVDVDGIIDYAYEACERGRKSRRRLEITKRRRPLCTPLPLRSFPLWY
jgi:hypothetical protein